MGLVTMMSDTIFILSLSVEALKMLRFETADALGPQAMDLKTNYLLSHLHLMCVVMVKNLNETLIINNLLIP